MAHKFEIYKDKAGEFRVRFSYNSEVMFSTQGYATKASAVNAIESIKKNGQVLRPKTIAPPDFSAQAHRSRGRG